MKSNMIAIRTCLLLGTLWAGGASATQVHFDLTETDFEGNFISLTTFDLPQSPVPDFVDEGVGSFFEIANVNQIINGVPGISDYSFYADNNDGGLQVGDDPNNYFAGAQLFGGTLTHPTLTIGTFDLLPYTNSDFLTVAISPVSGVPEPATFAMMLTGFAALGLAGSRRRKTTVFRLA